MQREKIPVNICLKISYDGTGFAGFQMQAGSLLTVQGVLEKALGRLYKQPVRVAAAGRTDAGVHAGTGGVTGLP